MLLFVDPLWKMPVIGSMIIGATCGLISVFIMLRKESLIGEALAHATYPGLTIATIISFIFQKNQFVFLFFGSCVSCILALLVLYVLQKKLNFSTDCSLCFVLSFFFGVGLFITSSMQLQFGPLYHFMQDFLFGSVATLTFAHVKWQLFFSLLVFVFLWFSYSTLWITLFDRQFAKSLGVQTGKVDFFLLLLVSVTIILGIPAVGVVLISGMIVIPGIAARQFSDKLSTIFSLSLCFGALCGYTGNFSSYYFAKTGLLDTSLPTGPMILLSMSSLCLIALLFAPKRGALFRMLRKLIFQMRCRQEHILKTLWRSGGVLSKKEIKKKHRLAAFSLLILIKQGWVEKVNRQYCLTEDGMKWSARLVRLHRLWEVYLTQYLDTSSSRVHQSADVIEHILNGDLEDNLEKMMGYNTIDPHHSLIPEKEVAW